MIRHRGWLSAAPMLGLLAMIVPAVWSRAPVRQDVPLFPLLDHAVEHVGPWQLGLLVLAGVFVGTLCDRRPLVIGLATVAVLPLAAIAEMFADKTSHNMFPFEFAIYAFYGCLAAVGAFVAQRWRQRGAGGAAGGGPGGRAGA